MTVILNAPHKFRNAQQIDANGETVGRRTLAERVQPWLALPARVLLLPFNIAIAVGKVALALAVALGLVLVLILALPLLGLVSLAGRVARRRTGDNAALQVTESQRGGRTLERANHKPGAQ